MRYLIVSLLPQDIDHGVRDAFQETFQEPIAIAHLHLSYLPPFFLKDSVNLDQLKSTIRNFTPTGTVNFITPQIFSASHHPTLVLPLIPQAPLSTLNVQLDKECSSFISYDVSVYKNQQIPPFNPHISLSYNFTRPDLLEKFDYPKQEFSLSASTLLQETSPTHWEIA